MSYDKKYPCITEGISRQAHILRVEPGDYTHYTVIAERRNDGEVMIGIGSGYNAYGACEVSLDLLLSIDAAICDEVSALDNDNGSLIDRVVARISGQIGYFLEHAFERASLRQTDTWTAAVALWVGYVVNFVEPENWEEAVSVIGLIYRCRREDAAKILEELFYKKGDIPLDNLGHKV